VIKIQAEPQFTKELDGRLFRVTSLMKDLGLRGLLIYSDAGNAGNTRYLTNYRPFFGVALLVVRDDGERILVNTFNWDAPRARLASGTDRIESGFDTASLAVRALDALGLGPTASLGLVGSNLIPYQVHAAVFAGVRTEPADVQASYENLRLVKSTFEQDMLRQAAAMTDEAISSAMAEAGAGVTEADLAAVIEYRMKKAGADGLAFPASVASGPNTEKPVSLPTARRLERGDLVMVDAGATWEGYAADIARTFVVGEPNDRQREVCAAVAAALCAAMDRVEPGLPANMLHSAAVDALAAHGLDSYFTHRIGHGIGLETSLEPPDLQRDSIPLQSGMTFCIEPGVYIPGFGGIKIEDDVIVGEAGAEVISKSTRELVSV
jgi:Xaa-Pro aminopeptidase